MRSLAGKPCRAAVLAAAALGAGLACDNGVDPLATITVDVTPGADTLTFLGQSVRLSAVARDALGDPLRRAVFTWASSDDSVATVSPRGDVTATGNGVAWITATVAEVSDTAVVTVRQAVSALHFRQQPGNVNAGDTLRPPVTILLLDSGHRVVTDTAVAVTLALGTNPGGATLGGTTTVTTVAGIATFRDLWMVKAASGYTLVATAPGQDSVASGGFNVAPGPPVLSFIVQPGTAEGRVRFDPPPQVAAAEDKFGNPTPEVFVTLMLFTSPTGEELEGRATMPTVDHVATFDTLSLDLPGDGLVLQASSGASAPVLSNPFSVRLRFIQAVAGASHSCGVTVPSYDYCWGANDAAQLGEGTTQQRLSPAPVIGGGYPQLSAAGQVSCGLSPRFFGGCWGSNSSGQYGIGTTSQAFWPQPLAEGTFYLLQLGTGGLHTCGVTRGQVAYCWGSNTYGQLGDSSTTQQLSPVPVSGGLAFVQVSAGTSHTCGVTTANVAYCWGSDSSGQLGDGGTQDRLTPAPVRGGLSFVQVSAGDGYTCGVATDSTAYCWGSNAGGELGEGSTQERLQPTPVAGGLRFGSVSAGWGHTCGVTGGGVAYCWGDNTYGQLGDGSTSPSLQPTPVTGGLTFVQVSAGLTHTCGVATDGVAYCWGRNDRGQLGNGTTDQKLVPTAVIH